MANTQAVSGVNASFQKLVGHCLIRTFLVSVIAFILYVSFTTIAVGMYTREVGYTILYSADGESYDEVYSHYFEDGEDTRLAQYETDEHYYKTPIRSRLSAKQTHTVMWLAQAASGIIWLSMLYSVMWRAGDSDANKAELGKQKMDPLRGLKVALCADIPFAALYLVLIVTQSLGVGKIYPTVYKILTYSMFAFNDTFLPSAGNGFTVTAGGLAALVVVLVPIPLFSAIGYWFGRKHILLKDRILYKKAKS